MIALLRAKLVTLLPFFARWIEVAPAACCGVCPTCIGTAVTGLILPMAADRNPSNPHEPGS